MDPTGLRSNISQGIMQFLDQTKHKVLDLKKIDPRVAKAVEWVAVALLVVICCGALFLRMKMEFDQQKKLNEYPDLRMKGKEELDAAAKNHLSDQEDIEQTQLPVYKGNNNNSVPEQIALAAICIERYKNLAVALSVLRTITDQLKKNPVDEEKERLKRQFEENHIICKHHFEDYAQAEKALKEKFPNAEVTKAYFAKHNVARKLFNQIAHEINALKL